MRNYQDKLRMIALQLLLQLLFGRVIQVTRPLWLTDAFYISMCEQLCFVCHLHEIVFFFQCAFLNIAAVSIVEQPDFNNRHDSCRITIMSSIEMLKDLEPEFVLKVSYKYYILHNITNIASFRLELLGPSLMPHHLSHRSSQNLKIYAAADLQIDFFKYIYSHKNYNCFKVENDTIGRMEIFINFVAICLEIQIQINK